MKRLRIFVFIICILIMSLLSSCNIASLDSEVRDINAAINILNEGLKQIA